jgi:hypothetical protein
MKKAELMQLVAAGFSRNEILALEQVEEKEPTDTAQKPTEDKPADLRAMDQLVTAITALQKEVADLKKQPVEQEQKKATEDTGKYSDNDVLKLLQKVNAEAHVYDAPPKYDVEENLAAAYIAMMGGSSEKEEKNNE